MNTTHAIPLSAVVRDSPTNSRALFNPLISDEDQAFVDDIQARGQIRFVCLWMFQTGKFQIVYGHRRIAALRHLEMTHVEAALWDDEPDPSSLEDAYRLENLYESMWQRQELEEDLTVLLEHATVW